jgi:hypothetical protein
MHVGKHSIAVSSVMFKVHNSVEQLKETLIYNFQKFHITLHILHSYGPFVNGTDCILCKLSHGQVSSIMQNSAVLTGK